MPTVVFFAHQEDHAVNQVEDTEPGSGKLAGARGKYLRPMKNFVSLIMVAVSRLLWN